MSISHSSLIQGHWRQHKLQVPLVWEISPCNKVSNAVKKAGLTCDPVHSAQRVNWETWLQPTTQLSPAGMSAPTTHMQVHWGGGGVGEFWHQYPTFTKQRLYMLAHFDSSVRDSTKPQSLDHGYIWSLCQPGRLFHKYHEVLPKPAVICIYILLTHYTSSLYSQSH